MGTTSSNLDKPVGCYQFGVSGQTKVSKKDSNPFRTPAEQPISPPTHLACGTCRFLSAATRDACCTRLSPHLNSGRSASLGVPTVTQSQEVITSEFIINRVIQADPANMSHSGFNSMQFHRSSTTNVPPHRPGSSRLWSGPLTLVPNPSRLTDSIPETHHPADLFKSQQSTWTVEETCEERREELDHKEAMESDYYVNMIREEHNQMTSIETLTELHVKRLGQLISLWSNCELDQLSSQFDELITIESVESDAMSARPKVTDLEEDLGSLSNSEWCSNLHVTFNNVQSGAHSYLLAIQSPVLANVLSPLYHLHRHSAQPKLSVPTLNILPCSAVYWCDKLTDPQERQQHMLLQQSSITKPNVCSPDLLPKCTINAGTNHCSSPQLERIDNPNQYVGLSPDGYQTYLPKLTTGDKTSSLVALKRLLFDLYRGMSVLQDPAFINPGQLGNRTKPDILCQSTINNVKPRMDLVPLYNLLHTESADSPLAPDCCLRFISRGTTNSLLTIPCHAGLLAARSLFLRRLLSRRYTPPQQLRDDLTTIVLDGALLNPCFGPILVHFIYVDQLHLNRIANLPVNDASFPTAKTMPPILLTQKVHERWHTKHCEQTVNRQLVCCCQPCPLSDRAQPLTGPYSGWMRFCLRCPFCVARVLELHPVGQYLEFPRLSQACEDVVVEALQLQPLHNYEFTNSSNDPQAILDQLHMTPISLAVGLLQWTGGTVSSRLSQLATGIMGHNCASVDPHWVSSHGHQGSNSDGQSSHSASPSPTPTVLTDLHSEDVGGSEARYLHRQAMRCLRSNFMQLVRTPSVLRRLNPRQLRELIQSSLVQAPESEILSALLCWSEQRLKCENSTRSTGNQRKLNGYLNLVSSLCEQPSPLRDTPQDRAPNPWLLSHLDSSSTTGTMNQQTNLLIKRFAHQTNTATPLQSRNACALCTADPLFTALALDPVNPASLARLLHRHRLLNQLRPAHLLHSLPLGLSSVLLQYQLSGSDAHTEDVMTGQRPGERPVVSSSASMDLMTVGVRGLSKQVWPGGEHTEWLPWLTSCLLSLPKSDKVERTLEPDQGSPLLSLKLGSGLVSQLPHSAPAQVSSKSLWLCASRRDEYPSTDLRCMSLPCECRWTNGPQTDSLIAEETLPDCTQAAMSNTQAQNENGVTRLPPRLFFPFVNYVRLLQRRTRDNQPSCTCLDAVATFKEVSGNPVSPVTRRLIQNDSSNLKTQEILISTDVLKPTLSVNSTSNCCTVRCREVSTCLLSSSQWDSLIERYLELLEQFTASHPNYTLSFGRMQLLRQFRLHALREHGLPDSLQELLACRINDHLLLVNKQQQTPSRKPGHVIGSNDGGELDSSISTFACEACNNVEKDALDTAMDTVAFDATEQWDHTEGTNSCVACQMSEQTTRPPSEGESRLNNSFCSDADLLLSSTKSHTQETSSCTCPQFLVLPSRWDANCPGSDMRLQEQIKCNQLHPGAIQTTWLGVPAPTNVPPFKPDMSKPLMCPSIANSKSLMHVYPRHMDSVDGLLHYASHEALGSHDRLRLPRSVSFSSSSSANDYCSSSTSSILHHESIASKSDTDLSEQAFCTQLNQSRYDSKTSSKVDNKHRCHASLVLNVNM